MALVPAGDRPGALIMPALEIRRLETEQRKGMGTWMDDVYAYSGDAEASATAADTASLLPDGTRRGIDYPGWPVADAAELTDLERDWCAVTGRMGAQMSANAFQALARALKAAGLEQGAVGADDARTADWLNECALDKLTVSYRPQLFNEIKQHRRIITCENCNRILYYQDH